MTLQISEIFLSLQGETTAAGFPSLFIRLAGCNLRCSYCDTSSAWTGGAPMSIAQIMEKARPYKWVHHVTITGGEPLMQKETPLLAEALIEEGFRVRVETNGSFDIGILPAECEKMVDVKSPSSGEDASFCMANIGRLTCKDEIKFVASDETDFQHAVSFYNNNLKQSPAVIDISPAEGSMTGARLAQLILESRIPMRLNLQLHKILWPKGEPK